MRLNRACKAGLIIALLGALSILRSLMGIAGFYSSGGYGPPPEPLRFFMQLGLVLLVAGIALIVIGFVFGKILVR